MKPLDMIGGAAALETIVDAFYHKVIGDDELAPFFADTDMRRMRAKQKGFLLMLTMTIEKEGMATELRWLILTNLLKRDTILLEEKSRITQ